MYKYFKTAALLLMAMGLIIPGMVFSQDSSNSEVDFGLEEIIVTARKVEESIQDIPLSVNAYSAEQIKKQAITSVEDLIGFTPGVVVSNQTGSRRYPAIRFRTIDSSSVERNKQTSSAFVDGVYIPGSSQWVSMNDIERVEVVKGPQSAFFGRATFAGAVNFITKTPGNEFSGDIQAIIGDNGRQDIWLSGEGALIEDKLTFRASGRYYTYDGAWENEHPSGGDIGAQETKALSLTLFASPTENLDIKLRHSVNEDDDGMSTQFIIDGSENNCGPFTTNGVTGTSDYYCGTLSRDLITGGVSVDNTPLTDNSFADELGLKREVTLTSLNVDWDISGSGYMLTSVTGMFKEETSEYKSQIPNELDVFVEWEDESFSQEFRLASPQDQRLRWMVGAYYLDLEYYKDGQVGFPSPGPAGIFSLGDERGGPGLFGVNPQPTEAIENKAIFGSLAYDFTDQLTLSLELRREEESIDAGGSALTQEAMPLDPLDPIGSAQPFGGADIPVAATFKATLPRVILDYKLNDDTLLYLSYAQGNTPGGFNPEVIQLEPTVAFPAFQASEGAGYTVEQGGLDAYELGFKHSLAEGRGNLNAAIYAMEWTNQRFRGFARDTDSNGDGVYIPGSDRLGGQIDYDRNGSTDILGFEVSGSYALNENWVTSLGYNYNKSDIQVYEDAQNGRVFGDTDASGLETANAPDQTATFALAFNMPATNLFDGDGEWFARLDSTYQGEAYNWTINLAKTEAAFQHNLRGGWQNGRYSLTAWIENLADDDSVMASQRTTGSFLTGKLGYLLSLPEPRTFGLTFRASFGE